MRASACSCVCAQRRSGGAPAVALCLPFVIGWLLILPLVYSPSEVKRQTTVEEVNSLLKAASEEAPLKGILGFETEQLVSTDYVNDPRSGIVDAECTQARPPIAPHCSPEREVAGTRPAPSFCARAHTLLAPALVTRALLRLLVIAGDRRDHGEALRLVRSVSESAE